MTEIKDKDLEKAAGGAMKHPRTDAVKVDPEGSCISFRFDEERLNQGETEQKCKNCAYFTGNTNYCIH